MILETIIPTKVLLHQAPLDFVKLTFFRAGAFSDAAGRQLNG